MTITALKTRVKDLSQEMFFIISALHHGKDDVEFIAVARSEDEVGQVLDRYKKLRDPNERNVYFVHHATPHQTILSRGLRRFALEVRQEAEQEKKRGSSAKRRRNGLRLAHTNLDKDVGWKRTRSRKATRSRTP